MLFDTSILHKAENTADVTRYILMMRVYHPELTALERSALQVRPLLERHPDALHRPRVTTPPA